MPQPTLGLPAARSLNFSLRHSLHPHKSPTVTSDNCSEYSQDNGSYLRRSLKDRRPTARNAMDIFASKDKRKSLGVHEGGRSSSPAKASPTRTPKGTPLNSPKMGPAKPAKLVVDMESPPLVFYGTPTSSSGALLSGQLLLMVTDPDIKLKSFTMNLTATTVTRRPVAKDCPDCAAKSNVLHTWKFLTEATRFKNGTHQFPFSFLLPGHLPATALSELGSINYVLDVRATTALDEAITVSRNLVVQRALMPGMDKNSIRVFPPTNLTATVALPSFVHPIGQFPVQLRLTGIVDSSLKDIQRRWRIRKMNWRIAETTKIISPACPKHANRVGGEGKGFLIEEQRTIGGQDIKTGWKTDFDTQGGQIEVEFQASCNHPVRPPMLCDLESPNGLAVSHMLHLEIVVAEEQTASKTHKHLATPTGAARVLRMQFKLVLTERAGMGISWDEEQPPMYEDVPRSPPGYTRMDDWEGGDLPPVEEGETLPAGVGSSRQ